MFVSYLHLLLKAAIILVALLALKLAIDHLGFDVISAGPIITAFVAGVIFTIAIIYTGTLSDYKEGERIPGELATSIKSLYKDSRVVRSTSSDETTVRDTESHIKELLAVIISNFKRSVWRLREIGEAMDKIDEDIYILAKNNVAPQLVVKMRNELTNIDRISYRVEGIMETTFIPAAYIITQIAIGLVIVMLLFVEMDPYYVGVALFGTVSFLLISLLLLIKDMDNPFAGTVQVDLSSLYKLQEYLKNK
jgi:hypothetical protein